MESIHASSVMIFVAFGIVGFAVVLAVGFMVWDRVQPVVSRLLGGVTVGESLSAWVHRRGSQRDEDDGGDGDDDVDDTTAALLALLPTASLVVGPANEVVRANPEAYRLGLMRDDEIVNKEVLAAIHEVREYGGRRHCELQTMTPEQFLPSSSQAHSGEEHRVEEGMSMVSRPNWLRVTVGRMGRRWIVVLIDDVSEGIRFGQVRDAFIENVSQQLLKPTQALRHLADALECGDMDDREAIRRDALQVRRSCAHMEHMVADLLLLMKAQAPVEPSANNRVTVAEQLERVAQRLQPEAESAQVTVQVGADEGLTVHGDAGQIGVAVEKMVRNALWYSSPGMQVALTAAATPAGDGVVIRVIDRGVGISRDEQERIFERFYRGRNQTDRTQDGIGLGLAIVKHVALTHHGSVGVWSAPGQGSTFSLTLPAAR